MYICIISPLPYPHGFFQHIPFELHSNDILKVKMTQQINESFFSLILICPIIIILVLPLTFHIAANVNKMCLMTVAAHIQSIFSLYLICFPITKEECKIFFTNRINFFPGLIE